ncbi:MAG: hypothetical protein IPI05_05915 [Flavobacteriales bacterium]|nr:hypothetical protein [Flavobacteriales bacterium]
METSLRIKVSELDMDLLNKIKRLFDKDRELTLTIRSSTDFELTRSESKKVYLQRLDKAIKTSKRGMWSHFQRPIWMLW